MKTNSPVESSLPKNPNLAELPSCHLNSTPLSSLLSLPSEPISTVEPVIAILFTLCVPVTFKVPVIVKLPPTLVLPLLAVTTNLSLIFKSPLKS